MSYIGSFIKYIKYETTHGQHHCCGDGMEPRLSGTGCDRRFHILMSAETLKRPRRRKHTHSSTETYLASNLYTERHRGNYHLEMDHRSTANRLRQSTRRLQHLDAILGSSPTRPKLTNKMPNPARVKKATQHCLLSSLPREYVRHVRRRLGWGSSPLRTFAVFAPAQ